MFRTVSVHQHPSWSGDLRRGNDIALLKLDRDAKQQPLKLPDNPVNVDSLDMLEIIGWGETESGTLADDLMLADVDIFPRSLCNSPMLFGPFVSDSMLCAGGRGRDSCVGDSGGPIVDVSSSRQEVVVGITSFGKTGVCGEPGTPTVYTLINPYLDWIKSVTGLTKAPAPRPQPSPASPLPGSNSGWNSGWWRPDVLEYLQVSQAKNNCASGGDDWKPDGKANGCGFCKTLPSATQIADCLECCCTTGNMAMQWSYPGCPGVQGSPTRVGGNELSSQPWPQWPSTGGWSQTATTWNGYGRQYP